MLKKGISMQQQIAIELARRAIENVNYYRGFGEQIKFTFDDQDFYVAFADLVEQYVIESNAFGFS